MSKRLISVLVALIMVIGLMPAVGATGADISSQFSDMPNNWATEALEFAVANHLLQGADGKIMPDKPLTRAEMATIIVRAFGASEEGDISSYTDVRKSDWFFEYIAKAFKMGVMEGYSGKMNPDSNITREQAFTVLARALKLQPATRISKTFSDIEEISDWARGSIYALVNAGYIQGSNGKLNPKADITRAEFAQVMFNLIKQYISEEGEYTEVAEGNVMINVPGATLKGLTVSGDLIIGDGVGDGDVVLDDVVVTGRLVIRGGGENSIIIRGNSNVSYIVAARVDGTVRILVEDDAEVEVIYVDDGSDDIIVEGNVGQIEIVADNVTVLATGASIGSANITGVNSRITVDADSEVESISVRAANASIDVEGSVNEISTSGANTNVTGGGKVDKVNVEQGGNGASITTPNTEISVGENVTGVTAGGGEEVEGGQTVKNNKDGTGIVSEPPASGGTYVPPVIPVRSISVEPAELTLTVGATETLAVTFDPTNATDKTVTWTTSDEEVATVADGVVTAVGEGTATITVTSNNGKEATCVVTVIPEVTGPIESEATIGSVVLPEGDPFAWANAYDNSVWTDLTVTGSLDYVDEATSVGFTGEYWFLPFAIKAPSEITDLTAAKVSITGKRDGVEVENNYTGSQFEDYNEGKALLVVWGVEAGENEITIVVDWDGDGTTYSAKTYTINLDGLTLNPEVTGPIESEATIGSVVLPEGDPFAWANEFDKSVITKDFYWGSVELEKIVVE